MNSNGLKLLFIACPFPPYPAVAAVRTWNMARSLVRLGWQVTVVTPHPSVWRHVHDIEESNRRIREAGIRRILTRRYPRWLEPEIVNCRNTGLRWLVGGICRRVARRLEIDNWGAWARDAERACSSLQPGDVDVILASGSPFASFGLANRLARRLGRPYVLDYRDPWSGNPHSAPDNRFSFLNSGFSCSAAVMRREARLLAESAAVTIVSPSWGAALDRRFCVGRKRHVITNGFDPAELDCVTPLDFGHFAIVYTGNFYPPKRVISPVMSALSLIRDSGPKTEWRFHYYGDGEAHVRAEAKRHNVLQHVVLHGRTPREEALSAVRGAGVTVVISTVDDESLPEDRGIVPAKLFETIGLASPTLVIAPDDSDVKTIAESSGVARTFRGSDTRNIATYLLELMNGRAPVCANRGMYAWTTLAEKLNTVLQSVAVRKTEAGAAETQRTAEVIS